MFGGGSWDQESDSLSVWAKATRLEMWSAWGTPSGSQRRSGWLLRSARHCLSELLSELSSELLWGLCLQKKWGKEMAIHQKR